MKNYPLLSIIIPTKDRYDCLIEVLSSLITIKSEEIEFIIQDNSFDNSRFLHFVPTLNDNRFKYFYTKDSLAIIENSDRAILNSNGKFVCFIGDDDIIVDNILEMVILMEEMKIDCLIQNPATYYWPDISFKYSNKLQMPGTILLNSNINMNLSKIDTSLELMHVAKTGGTAIGNLPRIYHGIVTREILDKIYKLCGSYFPGPSPDMASSVALAKFSENCFKINIPFTISGKSAVSTSGMGVAHTHVGDLAKLNFLPSDILITWDENIPKFWSCSTIWAQSLVSALKASNSNLTIDYSRLYSHLLVYEKRYSQVIRKSLQESTCGNTVLKRVPIYLRSYIVFVKRIMNYLKRKFLKDESYISINGIQSISDCFSKVNFIVAAASVTSKPQKL